MFKEHSYHPSIHIIYTSDVLEHKGRASLWTKGEQACAQSKHFKRIYQFISKSISMKLLWPLYTIDNKYYFLTSITRVLVFTQSTLPLCPVHSLFTLSILSLYSPYSPFTQSILSLYTVHTLPLQSILSLYTVHTLPLHSPYSPFTQSVLSLYSPYSPFTQSILSLYTVHTLPLFSPHPPFTQFTLSFFFHICLCKS